MEHAPKTSRPSRTSAGRSSEPRRPGRDDVIPADLRQTIGEVVRILFLRRWVFFVPFCLATTAAFIASQYVPRTFKANTTFEQAKDAVSVSLPPEIVLAKFGYLMNTLDQDIRSVEVVGPIADELGLTDHLERNEDGSFTEEVAEERERICKALTANVAVTAYRKSQYGNVIDLSYTGSDPAVMTRLLDGMKEGYKRLVRRKVTETLAETRNWHLEKAADKRAILDEIDRRLTTIRMNHPGVDPSNPESIAFRLSSLKDRLAEAVRTRARLGSLVSAQREFLAKARSRPAPEAPEAPEPRPIPKWVSPQARRLMTAIEDTEQRITDLKFTRGMTERHPDIVEERQLQKRYAQALAEEEARQTQPPLAAPTTGEPERQWAGPTQDVWMPAIAQAEAELAGLIEQQKENGEEIVALERSVGEYVAMQGEIFDNRQEFSRIQEDRDRATEDFDRYQGVAAQCSRALTVENENRGILFTDVVPVQGSLAPVSPLAKTVLLLSLLAGVATGTAFVVIAELFDRRFRTTAQVTRALGLPILESIDEIIVATQRRKQFVRRAVVVPAVSLVLLGMICISGGLSYLSLTNPTKFARVADYPKAAWAKVSAAGDQGTADADATGPVHED